VAALARRAEMLSALAAETRADAERTGGAVLVRAHDVARTGEVPRLFEELVRELGGLDLLIYAAGIMPEIGKDEYDTGKDLSILDVNLAGCAAWCNPAANLFRTQRAGTLVGISSIAGDRGRKGNPMYCTSKAAMNTYLEALRNRLAEVGAHVCTIRPGYVDTAMTQGMEKLFWLIGPDEAARQILAAARNRVNVRYVPLRWTAVGVVLRLVPSFLFRRASI
jgi:NAD(P)-dependent dehydrogenase (short-subunit alcohol dehydrogenase family)